MGVYGIGFPDMTMTSMTYRKANQGEISEGPGSLGEPGLKAPASRHTFFKCWSLTWSKRFLHTLAHDLAAKLQKPAKQLTNIRATLSKFSWLPSFSPCASRLAMVSRPSLVEIGYPWLAPGYQCELIKWTWSGTMSSACPSHYRDASVGHRWVMRWGSVRWRKSAGNFASAMARGKEHVSGG